MSIIVLSISKSINIPSALSERTSERGKGKLTFSTSLRNVCRVRISKARSPTLKLLIVDGKARKLKVVTGLDGGMSERVKGKGEIDAIPRPNLHTGCVDATVNAVLN